MPALASGRALTILVFLLVIFGLIMLASAGVVEGQKKFNSPYYHLKHQLFPGAAAGLAIFLIAAGINYKKLKGLALPFLIAVVGVMVLVFVPGFGLTIKGAQRWVSVGPLVFQPSELLKLAIIVYLAAWFSRRQARTIGRSSSAIAPFFLVLAFVALLLVLQPDIKTLALITGIAVAMYFFAGARTKIVIAVISIFLVLISALSFAPYRLNRIKAYLNPSQDIQGVAYHVNQAQIGIGAGGIFGLGYGQSRQKFNFLPEPVGDSIFAIIVEELGFIGGAAVILLFILLLLSLTSIAKNSHDNFGRLLVLGVAVWVIGQAFINIAAILNLIPLTGVPLPFISFGSSSLVAIMAAMGLAVSVASNS